VAAPDGYVFTGAGKGGNGALDSDVGADGNSTSVNVTSGSNNVDLDAGVYRPATERSGVDRCQPRWSPE
jgi:hypothetical protein